MNTGCRRASQRDANTRVGATVNMTGSARHGGSIAGGVLLFAAMVAVPVLLSGCPVFPPDGNNLPLFVNRTDKTNGGAAFVGSAACRQCHSEIAAQHANHAHAFALTAVRGAAPEFPNEAESGGVPNPPQGFAWSDVSYVVGGFSRAARFVNQAGEWITTGHDGVEAQWNLRFPANGTAAAFVPFLPAATGPAPLEFQSFAPRTTGPQPRTEESPLSQGNRSGIDGTWFEDGVQCEACHGPGGNHFFALGTRVQIDRTRIFVDPSGSDSCRQCHTQPYGEPGGPILAKDGYIEPLQQSAELAASGAHARFTCTTCHDPHRSLRFDRETAIRNDCTACHATQNMAGHRGKMFEKGGYREALRCESCHMPFAVRDGSNADEDFAGEAGRIGDTRSHIFRLSVRAVDSSAFLTEDGRQVRLDESGRAALTVDYVCIRCHNGDGLFPLTVSRAAEIAARVHDFPE